MDAVVLLKEDHKKVDKLFKRFEKAGDRALATKRTGSRRFARPWAVRPWWSLAAGWRPPGRRRREIR